MLHSGMLPFGQTVLLWRLARGKSQEQLARAAGVPRPNLSAIERDARDVSLRTLRALAAALDVKPGILADGVAPQGALSKKWTREALERIASSVVRHVSLPDKQENALARDLESMMHSRLRACGHSLLKSPRSIQSVDRLWMKVRATENRDVLASLVQRISELASRHSL